MLSMRLGSEQSVRKTTSSIWELKEENLVKEMEEW